MSDEKDNAPLSDSLEKDLESSTAQKNAKKRWGKVKNEVVHVVTAFGAFKNNLPLPSTSRFQEALEGPELEDLKVGEKTIFSPDEVWPFLLRFPVNTCGICIGLGSQVLLWRKLHTEPSVKWANIPIEISTVLWYITTALLIAYGITYGLKIILWSSVVRREWQHPVRNNFFYGPFLAAMGLAANVPTHIAKVPNESIFVILAIPVFILDLRVFGEWFLGSRRLLSVVANPTTNLVVSANFICANLGGVVGWKEPGKMFFFIGLAHYIAVSVTLYQKLPSTQRIPDIMHPVSFMFMSPAAAAALAWLKLSGGVFGDVVKGFFWLAIFIFACLIVRLRVFWNIKFSLSWWAYTFPMALVAVASIHYANTHTNKFTQTASFALSITSTVTIIYVSAITLSKLIANQLFPNDTAVNIEEKSTPI